MPQLRMQPDYANWTIPHLDSVLPHNGATLIAESQMQHIQQALEGLLQDDGIQITSRRNMPHYALFEVHVTTDTPNIEDIREKLSHHEGWMVGIHPQPSDNSVWHVLIQTDDHRPMTLQQVMLRPAFRKAESAHTIIMGVTLEQHIVIRNLETLQHLIVAGDDAITRNIVRGLLVTLLLSNTPSQLRVAFIGNERSADSGLEETPHMLGKAVNHVARGILLLNGMLREVRRRQTQLRKSGYQSIMEFNAENAQNGMPHILIVISALTSPAWMTRHEKWLNILNRIIRDGVSVGMHTILIVPDVSNELLHPLFAGIHTKLLARSIAQDYARHIDNFDESLWNFVDALLVENDTMKPVEMPVVTDSDTQAITAYWHKNAEERTQSNRLNNMTQKGGITSLFQKLQRDTQTPTPPVPQTPPVEVLAYAASVLSHSNQLTQNAQDTSIPETMLIDNDVEVTITEDEETSANTTQVTDISDEVSIQFESIRRAHALASYLGWLGRGPLMDILGLSVREAELIIAILQARQILERTDTPTPRLRSSQIR